jgi:hypothetical protein
VDLEFTAKLWYWRGPSPFHFLTVPTRQCEALHAASSSVTYGWGMIPVTARIGSTRFTTSLFPKDGGYVVPVRASVRRAEDLVLDDTVTVHLAIAT